MNRLWLRVARLRHDGNHSANPKRRLGNREFAMLCNYVQYRLLHPFFDI